MHLSLEEIMNILETDADAIDTDLAVEVTDLISNLLAENRAMRTEIMINTASTDPDQKVKADAGKPRLTLVPPRIIWDIAAVREFGTKKYKDPDNWRQVSKQRYRDAMFRHMMQYLATPHGLDPESGLPHLWHLVTNGAFLCQLEDEDGLGEKE